MAGTPQRPDEPPRISAIVPSYNSAATLGAVLDALVAQVPALHEILVADSSDDPAALALLERYGARGVRRIPLPTRTPPSPARNAGAKAATGAWLAFVDADAPPRPDWSRQLQQVIAAGHRVGGGSLRLADRQRGTPIAAAQYFLQFNEFLPILRPRRATFTPSANLFCERELFFAVGGFPDIRASEDVAFGHAVGKHAPFGFFPELCVDHIFRTEARSIAANQRMLGSYAYAWRNAAPEGFFCRGSRAKWLWPLVAAAKALRIGLRVLRAGDVRYVARFVMALPWFVWGTWHWGRGFGEGPTVTVTIPLR
jgi:glycosyltransferase involved in cell wall biosynthesis